VPARTTSGAPKKARWTAAQKAAARKTSGHKTPGRNTPARKTPDRQGASTSPRRGRAARAGRSPGAETPFTSDRTDRPVRPRQASRPEGDATSRRERRFEDRPKRVNSGANEESRRRHDRAAHQPQMTRGHLPGRSPAGVDPEAERLAADAWTKATRRPLSAGPVEVAPNNAFAALGLPERVVERLAREGITEPFPIQAAAIPDALAGRDVLGRGRTGSGKTLAFGLPTVARLAADAPSSAPRRPRALILVPTRELAMQVSDALEPFVHVMGLRHKLVAGGLSYTTQIAALNRGVDLLIATPGRLNDLLDRGAVELGDVRIAVLDEADHMAEMGFLPEVTAILDRLPVGGQRLLFSATLDRGVDGLVERYLDDPVTRSTDEAVAAVTTMRHHVLLVEPTHKKVITAEVANRPGRTLVFVRTKLGADRVAEQLREQGVLAAALHGGLSQGVRNRVLGAFREGSLPVLVATDVAARGIHVDDVSVVLQVDPPADHKDYLHRAGRTARAGEAGTVVTLALPHQRRIMERQLREAGVDAIPARGAPGDLAITATGGGTPSGLPVPDAVFRRLLEADRRPARRSSRSARPHRPERSGPRVAKPADPHTGGGRRPRG
jgi:superfamily II DNA/RNA helicase